MAENRSNSGLKNSVRSLKAGRSCIIVGIAAEHLSAKRLADMGFVTGARVKMIRRGNPCIVGIGGTFLGFGAANQTCVMVGQPEDEADSEPSTVPVPIQP
jgi:Fe2+ transport system protein FeoA